MGFCDIKGKDLMTITVRDTFQVIYKKKTAAAHKAVITRSKK